MKRLLLALLPWMAMTSVAWGQSPVDVVFTHFGALTDRCVRVDDECFVPFTVLNKIGWTYTRKGDSLEIHTDDGKVRVSVREVGDVPMIPIRQAIEKLGGETNWNDDRLVVLSPLNQVRIFKGHFNIQSTLPIKPKLSVLDNPNRVIIDLQGAKLTRKTNVDLDGNARIAQYKPDVVRVVLETNFDPQFAKRIFEPGHSFEFDVAESKTPAKTDGPSQSVAENELARPVQTGSKVPLTQSQQIQYDPASNPDMQQPAITPAGFPSNTQVGPLTMDSEGSKTAAATLKISGGLQKMPVFRRPDANVVEIVLPGAKRSDDADFTQAKGATIRDIDVRDENGSLVVALTLARPMGIEFSLSANGLQIQFLKPEIGNGHLAGKTVVVDAGHGGHDNGTESSGYKEKDFTLAIAKLLSQKLANEGATVIMTRKTDVFISLDERPAIANRNGADFFVSVHINSNEIDNTASGSITFFHAKDPICQLLADCVQREVVKVNGIGGMGVWSDQKIWKKSGFAVLRGAKMPAVLVECGFLNTKKDRARMLTDDFRDGIATSIVKGLKVFLGDEGKKK